MGGVVSAIGDAIGDVVEAVGDVAEAVVDAAVDVVEAVGDAVENTVQAAIDDPIGTIAKAAAIATGQFELLPLISAADVVAHGGSLEDAAKAGAISYVSQGVANYVAADLSIANQFDTTPFSEQTRMLADQSGGMIVKDQLSTAIGSAAGAATRTALSGGDVGDVLTSGLTGGAGSYVGQEVRGDTADLLGKTGSTIAGNVAGATTAGVLQGKDLNQVLGSSLVNNLINVNLANMNDSSKVQSGTTKKAEADTSDVMTAYNNLNAVDKQFVDMAVATGTDVNTAVNYAMANPTVSISNLNDVQYAAVNNGTKTDAGGKDYWTYSANGDVRTDPSGRSQLRSADGTFPGDEEAQNPANVSGNDTSSESAKPEFKYGSNGEVYALEKDGTYQKLDYVKINDQGKILTADTKGNWTETNDYAKGTEALRGSSDSQLTPDELKRGYYYASDGTMRSPDGNMLIKISGVGSNVTSPTEANVTPGSELDKAVNKIGGLLGLGGGDPSAPYHALFGGGAYIKGELDMSAFSPLGWGTKEEKDQALNYMEIVLNDPNATTQDKQLAQQAINRINESPVKGTSAGQTTTGGSATVAGGDTGGSNTTAGASNASGSTSSSSAINASTANYISSTVKNLEESGAKDSDIVTLLTNTFGLDQNKASTLTNVVANNGINAGNEFLLMSSNLTGTGTGTTSTSSTGTTGTGTTGTGTTGTGTTGTGTTGTGTTGTGTTGTGDGSGTTGTGTTGTGTTGTGTTGTGTTGTGTTGTGTTGTGTTGTGTGTGTVTGTETGTGGTTSTGVLDGSGGGKEVVDPNKGGTVTIPSTPSTGSSAVSALSYGTSGGATSGSQTGALPKGLNASYLSAAPIQDTSMNLGTLKQLYPQLAAVDPRILSTITGKSNVPAGGATGLTGGNLIMPSAGYPSQASGQSSSGVASFIPTNDLMSGSYDALSSAGLRSLGALPSAGSVQGLKKGGKVKNQSALPHIPEFVTGKTGHYVEGKGDGQSDDIPAMLADGEYVFDAETVAQLGNGSSKAGAQLLDHFRESLREHKRSAPTDKIPPAASPLAYMKAALKKHKG